MCMCVCITCAQESLKEGRGIRYPETRVTGVYELACMCKSSKPFLTADYQLYKQSEHGDCSVVKRKH